jgi:putative hemolysin
MPAIGFELFVILLLILANGVFAMAEMALVSARKARLQGWVEAGNIRARAALQLAQHPGEFLSTAQIGITLVGILAGAFGGVRLAAPPARHRPL